MNLLYGKDGRPAEYRLSEAEGRRYGLPAPPAKRAKPGAVATLRTLAQTRSRGADAVSAKEPFEARLSDARQAISADPVKDPALESRVKEVRESLGNSQSDDLANRVAAAKVSLGIGGGRV